MFDSLVFFKYFIYFEHLFLKIEEITVFSLKILFDLFQRRQHSLILKTNDVVEQQQIIIESMMSTLAMCS